MWGTWRNASSRTVAVLVVGAKGMTHISRAWMHRARRGTTSGGGSGAQCVCSGWGCWALFTRAWDYGLQILERREGGVGSLCVADDGAVLGHLLGLAFSRNRPGGGRGPASLDNRLARWWWGWSVGCLLRESCLVGALCSPVACAGGLRKECARMGVGGESGRRWEERRVAAGLPGREAAGRAAVAAGSLGGEAAGLKSFSPSHSLSSTPSS
mmetsp:Transcript_71113/g.189803  ORF Transcript_71113/g.189803 Transcript_71113/m.189803 type:complete len:212 (-) Transcript_71113:67-702(-)